MSELSTVFTVGEVGAVSNYRECLTSPRVKGTDGDEEEKRQLPPPSNGFSKRDVQTSLETERILLEIFYLLKDNSRITFAREPNSNQKYYKS